MKAENIYPIPIPQEQRWRRVLKAVRWCFAATAYICPLINLCVGGKAWSLVVLWGLWSVWTLAFSRDLIEYNRISQTSKLIVDTCVMLILIETFLSSGWAGFVVPIVSFASLIVMGVLFFTNLPIQKQNLMPMMWMIAAALVAIMASLIGWPKMNWPFIALGATAFALLIVTFIVLPKELIRELQKRFHTK